MSETRQLFLLRHAKSSWDEPSLADHDRPLAPRGRKAAKRIGAHVRREQIRVALVLCSSARRARETLDLVAPPGEVRIERELYGATSAELLERVRRVPDDVDAVMLIGHEPAIRDLAVGLVGSETELLRPSHSSGLRSQRLPDIGIVLVVCPMPGRCGFGLLALGRTACGRDTPRGRAGSDAPIEQR